MDISRLLNPAANKRHRTHFTEQSHQHQTSLAALLPVELVAHVLLYFQGTHRALYARVCRQWLRAYNMFHRNSYFSTRDHVYSKPVTKCSLLRSFRKHGHRVRIMHITSEILVAMFQLEPNFGELVPNVQHLFIRLSHRISSELLFGRFVVHLSQLRYLSLIDRGYAPDESFTMELDKSLADKPHLWGIMMDDIVLDSSHVPGPNLKAIAHQFRKFGFEVSGFESEDVVATLAPFSNLTELGLSNIASLEIMHAVVELITEPKNFPHLSGLLFIVDLDVSRTPPIHDESGNVITAMTLIERVCAIKRPKFELTLRMLLGACSTGDADLIEKERQYVSRLGKNHADVFFAVNLIHREPVGDYDPVTTFLLEGAARYPHMIVLRFDIPLNTRIKEKLAVAVNNTFLLPSLQALLLRVDGQLYKDSMQGYNPVEASRQIQFVIEDISVCDELRAANESGLENHKSSFAPDSDNEEH